MTLPTEILQRVFLQTSEAVVVMDPARRILAVNPAFTAITGYDAESVMGHTPKMLLSSRTETSSLNTLWQVVGECGVWSGELWNKRKDGSQHPVWLALSAVHDSQMAISHYIATFTDIGERKETSRQLRHLAYHDPLTQLPNRLAFESQLALAVRTAERDHSQLALMLIDLDHFKTVNDTLGHQVGDELLKSVASRLAQSVRGSDIVARLGGDEFVVVLPEVDSPLMASAIASKIQRALTDLSHSVGPHTLYATPSIGISLYPADGSDAQTLLRNADMAMYHAKGAGRNNFQFYANQMNDAAGERLQIENALRQAVSGITPVNSPFSLHFQPQINPRNGQVTGLEALARWEHPVMGSVPPDRFIPVAEETGLIQPLGDWIFWETCRNIRTFRDAGLSGFRVAVNISAQQLRHENLPLVVRGALACYDLQPSDLELEITESTAMQNPELTLALLHQFAAMGILLSIDDFGTGYSSLAYLKHLPIQRLKLDRSFVRDIQTDPNDAAICSATVALGHNLGLEVVAEGVETAAQRDYLQALGCDILQGYLYSRPLPAGQIIRYLQAHQADSR